MGYTILQGPNLQFLHRLLHGPYQSNGRRVPKARESSRRTRRWGGMWKGGIFSFQNSAFRYNFVANSTVLFAMKCTERYAITGFSWRSTVTKTSKHQVVINLVIWLGQYLASK